MGGAVGKVALVALGVALGAAIGAAAIDAITDLSQNAARAAAEAVFEAITEAAQAVRRYMSALHRTVTSAAAEAYDEVRRFVARACDAVKRAAACVSSRAVVLVERLHGTLAAGFAKRKLEGVNGLVDAADVASLVASIVDDIRGFSSPPIFPEQPFSQFAPSESPKARRAASSTAQVMELLDLLSSGVGEMLGLTKVPAAVEVAISVTGVAAQLVFAVLHA